MGVGPGQDWERPAFIGFIFDLPHSSLLSDSDRMVFSQKQPGTWNPSVLQATDFTALVACSPCHSMCTALIYILSLAKQSLNECALVSGVWWCIVFHLEGQALSRDTTTAASLYLGTCRV
jgi:hypothetical protein